MILIFRTVSVDVNGEESRITLIEVNNKISLQPNMKLNTNIRIQMLV